MTCNVAINEANDATKETGQQADRFNNALGIPTNYGAINANNGRKAHKKTTAANASPMQPSKDGGEEADTSE